MPNDFYSVFVSSCTGATTGWDHTDSFNIQMHDAELAMDIGKWKKGDVVDVIIFNLIDTETMTIQIQKGTVTYEYPVNDIQVTFGEEKIVSE